MHLIDARLSLHLIHIDDPLNPLIVEERHVVHDAKIALHIRQQEPSVDDRFHLTFCASSVNPVCFAFACASFRRIRKWQSAPVSPASFPNSAKAIRVAE